LDAGDTMAQVYVMIEGLCSAAPKDPDR